MAVPKAEYKKALNHWLIDNDKSWKWLCEQVKEQCGLYCDSAYLSHIFSGNRDGKSIIKALEQITGIKYGGD